MKPTFNLLTDSTGYVIETDGPVHLSVKEDGTTSIRIGALPSQQFRQIELKPEDEKPTKEKIIKSLPSEAKAIIDEIIPEHNPWDRVKESTSPEATSELFHPTINLGEKDKLNLVASAKKAIENLDTKEAEKEFDEQAKAIEQRKLDKQSLEVNLDQMLEKAKNNILILDKHLAEGGRVNVSDKYILNCQADLNQLVPFKYGWAWSLYLTSCDKHWMPAEMDLTADIEEFKHLKPSQKSILLRAWYNHEYQQLFVPTSSVLNCYRLITNPECRQYILRQAFEMCLTKHAWMYITESLVEEQTLAVHIVDGKGTKLRHSLAAVDQTFRERYSLVSYWLDAIHDQEFKTDSPEHVGQLIQELLIGFGYVNYIMQIPTYYQILNFSRNTNQLKGISGIVIRMLKDIRSQTEFLKLLLGNIVRENPNAFTSQHVENVTKFFKDAFTVEIDIVSLSSLTETEYYEVNQLLCEEINRLLNSVGMSFDKNFKPSNVEWFNDLLKELTPKINHSASISGSALNF